MSNKSEEDDDMTLWERVTSTIKPHTSSRHHRKKPEAAVLSDPQQKQQDPRRRPHTGKAPLAEVHQPKAKGFGGAAARRLKRGQIIIEGRLDLHGMTQKTAFDTLQSFIAEAQARGWRTVLIVTGKGSRQGTGVLRRLLPEWLSVPPLSDKVLSCVAARPKDGGQGAYYVRLVKFK